MEKILYWKIQVANQSSELVEGSREMEVYKTHNLKDYQTREKMTSVEAQEHYKQHAWKNPLFSKMYSLSLAFVDNNKIRVKHFTGDEKDLLLNFINTVKSNYFKDYKIACFDSEYLLAYLGIRLDKNGIKETLPSGLKYRGLKPWGLESICIRDFYKGAGAYKPSLKELAYIYDLKENLSDRYVENDLVRSNQHAMLELNSIEEIALIVNVHRSMHFNTVLEEFEVNSSEVKDVVLEAPKSIIHELLDTKQFNPEAWKKHLKARKMLKKEQEVAKKLILSAYLEKIDVMDFNKAQLQETNKQRTEEINKFFEDEFTKKV